MKTKISTRLYAFAIDYLVIISYAGILFGVVKLIQLNSDLFLSNLKPFEGQLIGFFTLTLPVILYFIIMENSNKQATIGKIFMKLKVSGFKSEKPSLKKIVIRNLFKFSPWEFAHLGLYWMVYYSTNNMDVPLWIWFTLICPQIIVVVFIISIFLNKDNRALYEIASQTKVIEGKSA